MQSTKAQAAKAKPPVRLNALIFAAYTALMFLSDFILNRNGTLPLWMMLVVFHFLLIFLSGIIYLFKDTRRAGNYIYVSAIIMGLGFLFFGLYMLLVVFIGGWEI